MDYIHAKRKAALKDPLAALERPGHRIKGLRGSNDLDELTELLPSLKRQVATERAERDKRERDLSNEVRGGVRVRTHSGAAGGSASRRAKVAAGTAALAGGELAGLGGGAGVGADAGAAASAGAEAPGALGQRKRPRPKVDTLRRALEGARGVRSGEGEEAEEAPAGEEEGGEEGAGAAGGGDLKRRRVREGAGGAKRGVGTGTRYGVNDTRAGSGAELAPLFG